MPFGVTGSVLHKQTLPLNHRFVETALRQPAPGPKCLHVILEGMFHFSDSERTDVLVLVWSRLEEQSVRGPTDDALSLSLLQLTLCTLTNEGRVLLSFLYDHFTRDHSLLLFSCPSVSEDSLQSVGVTLPIS